MWGEKNAKFAKEGGKFREEGLLVGVPLVGVGLGEADVGEDAVDEVAGYVGGGLRGVVEGGHDGVDGGAGFGDLRHVAEMDEVEGRLADA